MTDGDQSETIEFLSRGSSYGRPGETPQRVDTHASIVFLIGDRVYKLKRAVRFSFLDYSSVAARDRFCHAEFELNRRTAPQLYLGVRSITRKPDGELEWDGVGELVDSVVAMQRFDESELFDRLAASGRLTPALMTRLADEIAAFHGSAEITPAFGGAAAISAVIADTHRNLMLGCPPLDPSAVDGLRSACETALERVRGLLDARRAGGKVRRCHGDLHLRNICLLGGVPTLFDCIEFSDPIACIDVLYDLAFLLMDLEHRGLRPLANIVFNRYLDRTDETSGIAALPLLLSVRAGVRAMVAIASLSVEPKAAADAQAYLDLADALLRPARPRLIAVGGFSGTGKSTIATGLAPDFAPAPGARIIRSDVLRKSLLGVAPETRLPQSAYAHAVSERVYDALREQATTVLGAGYTAILDATFIDAAERDAVATTAARASVAFAGIWLAAPDTTLIERIARRRGDASDADRLVLMQQLAADTGAITWQKVDVGGDPGASLAAARQALQPITA